MSSVSLDECKELFLKLRRDYNAEYMLYGLDSLAIPVVLPKVFLLNFSKIDFYF